LENLSGIPGTLGGALRMNAGAFGSEISDHLKEVEILQPDGEILVLSKEEIGFSYRTAPRIKHRIILGGKFVLKSAGVEELLVAREKILAKRDEKQPWQFPSAGSVFKRPPGKFAGQLIEECGLKGKRYGRAGVSGKHSGFIVNYGGANAAEVLSLIHLIQRTVLEKFGVQLELEQELIGFDSNENWSKTRKDTKSI
jgi:UDP-N-acetylmuramate dehydrogenase